MKTLLFVLLLFVLHSCSNSADNPLQADTTSVDTVMPDSAAINHAIQKGTSLYGIQLPTGTLSLQQWDSTINLEQQLGKPVKQKTKQLDLNSDTFAGSFIKDLEFSGLKLKLFSPKQNGKSFWIQEIILTDPSYKTINNIGIGDEFEKVKRAYPSLKKFPGENENMYYVADEGYEKSIEMEFEKNKLKKLRMYYMMN